MEACFDAWTLEKTRLVSLDVAQENICGKHRVDVADVCRMAGVGEPYEALGQGEADPELVAEMVRSFDGIFRPA